MDVGVEDTRARSSSSGRECRERREPKRLEGRPCFWRLRGRDLVISLSMLLLESALLIGVRGLDGAMSDVGELEGLEEKVVAGRFFLSRPPTGALSGGSSMGVNAETGGGRKMLKDFLRCLRHNNHCHKHGSGRRSASGGKTCLSDIVMNIGSCSLFFQSGSRVNQRRYNIIA